MSMLDYQGKELDLFSRAVNWKRYWSSKVRPFLGSRVCEVGAGLGGTTAILCSGKHTTWMSLEPDSGLFTMLSGRKSRGDLPDFVTPMQGMITDLPVETQFDTVLYIDVLEHIQNDAKELSRAAVHVAPSGHLVVLSPAHMSLFSPFDKAIGHYRRYNRVSLNALCPIGMQVQKSFYLDSAGMLLSLANRLALRQGNPTRSQIAFWDSVVVPISRILDFCTGYKLGKSVVAVYVK